MLCIIRLKTSQKDRVGTKLLCFLKGWFSKHGTQLNRPVLWGVNKKEDRDDCCWFSPGYNKQDPCRKNSFCLYGKSQNSTHNHISSFNEQILWFLICESQKCVVLCLGVNRPSYHEILSIRYSFPSVYGFSVCTKRGNVFLRKTPESKHFVNMSWQKRCPTTPYNLGERERKRGKK